MDPISAQDHGLSCPPLWPIWLLVVSGILGTCSDSLYTSSQVLSPTARGCRLSRLQALWPPAFVSCAPRAEAEAAGKEVFAFPS